MNWLAHIFLSPPNIENQLGNLLADLLKGRTWDDMSEGMRAGIQLHQAIDSFTDSHPCWKNSVRSLGDVGHLRGVVVDLAYDHMLSRN
ncbi:MAG: hypothetical protein AAFX93_13525 [Verrucomicrobiota bacterium]